MLNHTYKPPPPLWPRVTRWWVEPAYVGWSSSWWLGIGLVVWVGVVNLGEAPSVANFGERWPSSPFLRFQAAILHGLLRGGGLGSGAEGSQFVEGRHSIADSRWRWPPAHCVLPTRQVWWGLFSGCIAKSFFWLCRQVVFLAVSPGCFLAVSPGCFSGCVARLFFWLCRQVCYWLCRQVVYGWFCQGSYSDVRQWCYSAGQGQLNIE